MAGTPPAVDAPAARRERLGIAELAVGLALLAGSLTGPWLTLLLPTALVFVIFDGRAVARAVAVPLAAIAALLALAAPGGVALLVIALGAVAGSMLAVARGRHAALDTLAIPAMAGAAAGLGIGLLAAPSLLAGWEAMLGRGVTEGGAMAIARYRDLGMDPETIAGLETMLGAVGVWLVKLWPAMAALTLWLGAWLAWRLYARWGKGAPELMERLARRRFTEFAVGLPAAWLLVAGLAGLWVEPLARAGANVALVAATLALLDGVAVTEWWLARHGVGLVWRMMGWFLALAFALPLAAAAMLGLGLVDVWMEFRERARIPRT